MFYFSPFHSHFWHPSEAQVWTLCIVLLHRTVIWPRKEVDSSPNFPLAFLVSLRNCLSAFLLPVSLLTCKRRQDPIIHSDFSWCIQTGYW